MIKLRGDDDAMGNDDQRSPTQSDDTIRLIITIQGKEYHVVKALPSVVRASSGPMSVRAGLEPALLRMMEQAIESVLEAAVTMIDEGMPRPREVWWAVDEALGKMDGEA